MTERALRENCQTSMPTRALARAAGGSGAPAATPPIRTMIRKNRYTVTAKERLFSQYRRKRMASRRISSLRRGRYSGTGSHPPGEVQEDLFQVGIPFVHPHHPGARPVQGVHDGVEGVAVRQQDPTDRHPVAKPLGHVELVGGENDGTALARQLPDPLLDQPGRRHAQTQGGLVKQQHPGVVDQGARSKKASSSAASYPGTRGTPAKGGKGRPRRAALAEVCGPLPYPHRRPVIEIAHDRRTDRDGEQDATQ